jgi:hypothetical protein
LVIKIISNLYKINMVSERNMLMLLVRDIFWWLTYLSTHFQA